MELVSAYRHRGQIPWRGLLLTASLLTAWSPPTTAEVTIEAVPPQVAEGKDILLLAHNLPQPFQVFYWYKGLGTETADEIARFKAGNITSQIGPAYSGRETIFSNGSLFLRNVNKSDEGGYTFNVLDDNFSSHKASVQFSVHKQVTQPSIQVTNTTVKELGSVTLTCFSNDTGISISWLFNSQSLRLTERMTLTQDNSTLTIDPIRKEDAGTYQCQISNPVSNQMSLPIRLEVITDPMEEDSGGLSEGAIAGIVIGAVAGVALIAALIYFLYSRKAGGGSDQRDLTEHKPSASNHNLAPSDNSPNKGDDVAYTVLNFNSQQPHQPTSAPLSPRATETVYSEVKKK